MNNKDFEQDIEYLKSKRDEQLNKLIIAITTGKCEEIINNKFKSLMRKQEQLALAKDAFCIYKKMKKKEKWKNNKIVQKIIELRKDYEFRFMYAGCSMGFGEIKIEDMWECDCCGTLASSLESVYHKTDKNKSIGICPTCGELWRVVPIVSNNEVAVCPECKSTRIFKHHGAMNECVQCGNEWQTDF